MFLQVLPGARPLGRPDRSPRPQQHGQGTGKEDDHPIRHSR